MKTKLLRKVRKLIFLEYNKDTEYYQLYEPDIYCYLEIKHKDTALTMYYNYVLNYARQISKRKGNNIVKIK